MQTWLVHMREPLALLRSAGRAAFSRSNFSSAGGAAALANPLLWLVFIFRLPPSRTNCRCGFTDQTRRDGIGETGLVDR